MKRIVRTISIVFLAVIVLVLGYLGVEAVFGGDHITLRGKAYGFEIGMTKQEAFDQYRNLNEDANIACYGSQPSQRGFELEKRSADLKFTDEFRASDHWHAYRKKYPIYYQEFYFRDGKLWKINTHLRFYELP